MTSTYEEKDELCHEVGQGTATAWVGVVTDAGERYRWYRGALPLSDADRTGDGGGRVRMALADGTEVAFEADRVDGILTVHRDVACVDSISRIRTADGRTGFCDFETTHNSRGGSEPVSVMVCAAMDDGLSRR